MYRIDICNRQSSLHVDEQGLCGLVESILRGEGISAAEVSLAVVTDHEIHRLNRQYLEHDYPTDVLSFVLSREGQSLEGEVIVSADTAIRCSLDFEWQGDEELLLYVAHGALHLVGYDDKTPDDQCQMKQREAHYLNLFGKQVSRVDGIGTMQQRTMGDR